jgi:aspartate kinase
MALLAMAISDRGAEARSYTGSQAGLITDRYHGQARIIDVTPGRIQGALDEGAIPIVAGFQGVAQDTKDVTTLGRGGSDTTAVALAAALAADVCEIYTDVDGVFSADPRVVPAARQVPYITYEEMLEMAAHGAKVLHLRCVEYARRFNVPLRVRSSFTDKPGTLVVHVSQDLSEAKITVTNVPDRPGEAALIFETLAGIGANLDMIVQNVSADGITDITLTLPKADVERAVGALAAAQAEIGFGKVFSDADIAKVSLVGAGMRSHPGVSATFFRTLAEAGVNVEMISTSEIRISVVTRADSAAAAVQALHSAFGLDAEGEAVVYAGTGR